MGYDGWELTAVIPLPKRVGAYPSPGKELHYRFLYRQPAPLLRLERPPFDEERTRKAIEAESAAASKEFQERLERR